jgi:hypothetical protein
LQPLVEELLELWSGVDTLDAITRKDFKLCAAMLWCIHDYPALSTLSVPQVVTLLVSIVIKILCRMP